MNLRPKADPGNANQLGAPMRGDVVDLKVTEGAKVEKGEVVAVLSAMKMEMAVQAPKSGTIKRIFVQKGDKVEGDDFIIEIE